MVVILVIILVHGHHPAHHHGPWHQFGKPGRLGGFDWTVSIIVVDQDHRMVIILVDQDDAS